jgi:hypothetical protein
MAFYLGAIAGNCIVLARAYAADGSKEAPMSQIATRPWHLWAAGLLSLIWNAFGGYDFVMKNVRAPGYVEQLPAEAIQFLDTLPLWTVVCWALGVWSAVLGSLLLLLRSRFAVHAFAASLLGLAANTAYTATSDSPTGQPVGLTVAIWALAIALLVYALRMRSLAVLR